MIEPSGDRIYKDQTNSFFALSIDASYSSSMSINRAEATRLARICLPKILLRQAETTVDAPSSYIEKYEEVSEINIKVKSLCRLWAGMGYIYQVTITLSSSQTYNFIIKHVVPPTKSRRSFGDARKATSYLIEANFYEHVALTLIDEYDDLSMPIPYHVERNNDTDEITICMSMLHGSPGYLEEKNIHAVLTWLATLHAATWGRGSVGSNNTKKKKLDTYISRQYIQPIGSYWHLNTRPNEHESMSKRGWEGRLKLAARAIDERLRRDKMQCIIHGDAKDANIMFDTSDEGGDRRVIVSMYDFQYCGMAPPSVDIAYFLCVAVGDTDSEYIQYYHKELLSKLNVDDYQPTLEELEESVAIALCDFQRFMCGWGQWGSDISSVVIKVLDRLDDGRVLTSEDAYREAMRREYG